MTVNQHEINTHLQALLEKHPLSVHTNISTVKRPQVALLCEAFWHSSSLWKFRVNQDTDAIVVIINMYVQILLICINPCIHKMFTAPQSVLVRLNLVLLGTQNPFLIDSPCVSSLFFQHRLSPSNCRRCLQVIITHLIKKTFHYMQMPFNPLQKQKIQAYQVLLTSGGLKTFDPAYH